jgi:uncharacterized protein YjiS (DUF1127 family)
MRQTFRYPGPAPLWSAVATATSPLHERAFRGGPRDGVLSRPVAQWLRRARDVIQLWQERSRGRRQLLMLDEHVLRDIGMTRLQAEAEANKPFWRA